MKTKTYLLTVAALSALGACAMTPNGTDSNMSVAEAHPITVDQQAVALRIGVDGSRSGLGRGDLARIDALVSDYRTRGHGPITVTAPVGGESDRAAQRTAADVRMALHAAGVPYDAMAGASVRTARADEVIVSFQSYVATGPSCGAVGYTASRRLRNLRSEDFGCASQANLAAMISDPRDLHGGSGADGSGDDALTKAILERSLAQTEIPTYELEIDE